MFGVGGERQGEGQSQEEVDEEAPSRRRSTVKTQSSLHVCSMLYIYLNIWISSNLSKSSKNQSYVILILSLGLDGIVFLNRR